MAKRKRGRALRKRYGHAMPLEVLEGRLKHLMNTVKARGGKVPS